MKRCIMILTAMVLCAGLFITPALAEKTLKKERHQSRESPAKVGRHAADKQIRQLKREIEAAKAGGLDFTNLLEQLRALRTPSNHRSERTRGLDDGGDVCGDATVILSLPYFDEGTLSGYANDVPQQCGGDAGDEVFYRFTAPSDMTIYVSTCGLDDFDTVLEIWEGCPGDDAVYIDCNDDYCNYQSCMAGIQLTQGLTYFIMVSGYDASETGDYDLTIAEGNDCPSPCGNNFVDGGDGCADAPYLTLPAAISGNNGTGSEIFINSGCDVDEVYQPQWYYVIGDGSEYTAETCDCDEFDAVIVIFCGDCCGYTCVASSDDECDSQPRVSWCTLPGQQYFVVVGGYAYNDYGNFSLTVSSGDPCETDDCQQPLDCVCDAEDGEPGVHCQRGSCTTISDYETSAAYVLVPEQYLITDVNVCLTISHTFIGDLEIWLESPEGTAVTLYEHDCIYQDDFPCIFFDDEAGELISNHCFDMGPGDAFSPDGDLSDFDGENAQGLWTLYVYDNYLGDEGGILGVCLYFDYDVILAAELVSFSALPGDGDVTLNWRTASESSNDRFDIRRNGVKIAEVDATNSATGSNYSWTDATVSNGTTYDYSLVSVDLSGTEDVLGTVSATPNFNTATVSEYALYQNYPNPFNPSTTISFDLLEAGTVNLSVFNMLGQRVGEVANGSYSAGRHAVEFDGSGLSSGVYFYRLEAGEFTAQKKLLLMK